MSLTKQNIPLKWADNDKVKFASLKVIIIDAYDRAKEIATKRSKNRAEQLLIFYAATTRYKLDNSLGLLDAEVCDQLWELISEHHMNTIEKKHINFIRGLDDDKISSSKYYFEQSEKNINKL